MSARLRNLDLHLLSAFRALADERHVSRAAQRLNLSQPAMSRILAKLRELFSDPLFIRTGNQLIMTPRAQALLPEVDACLVQLDRLLKQTEFIPQNATGKLVIATNDYGSSALIPSLHTRLRHVAPRLDLEVVSWQPGMLTQLAQLPVDLALCALEDTGADVHVKTLCEDYWVVIMASAHPLASQTLSQQAYLDCEHVVIPTGSAKKGALENFLSHQGMDRRIAIRVPHIITALQLVAQSELILTIPSMVAKAFQKQFALHIQPVPLQVPELSYTLA